MDQISSVFSRPLGFNLNPREKESFENIKREIDRCTDEILLQPDWGANLSCCDSINSSPSQAVYVLSFIYLYFLHFPSFFSSFFLVLMKLLLLYVENFQVVHQMLLYLHYILLNQLLKIVVIELIGYH